MPPPSTKQPSSSSSRDLRHHILTCTTKLSDRDTHSHAVSDLNTLIPTLTPPTFSLFITSLSSSSSSSRASARASSLRLLASLSSSHGPSLSPHLPKLISAVLRRLRDPDSAVRSSAASTTAAFAANITRSFSAIIRPLAESLATEQESTAQSAAALCLAAAVDASPEVDTWQVLKMLPKWMKLLKCERFKAKSSVLVLIRSVVRVCEVGKSDMVREVVECVVELLKSDDWMARKAAAEVLTEIAVVERDSLSELKNACLKIFEARKFDKVKGVREAMTQMVEIWKEIPDVVDGGSPAHSQASSKENASDSHYPAQPKLSSAVDSNTPESRRNNNRFRRSSSSDSALKTTTRNKGALVFTRKKSNPSVVRKLDSRKPSGGNVVVTDLHGSSGTPASENNLEGDGEGMTQVRPSKPRMRQGVFSKKPGSKVVPYVEEHDGNVVASGEPTSADTCMHHKDCEDLVSIREQLVQIENQQSSLMDLLRKHIESSHDGMHSLETRVHGLEMALDDISYDLALSTARISNAESSRTRCCSLPGSDFFSSKLWKRPESRYSTLRYSFSGNTPSVSALRSSGENDRVGITSKFEKRRFHRQGASEAIVNPLADIHGVSRRAPPVSTSSRMLRSLRVG